MKVIGLAIFACFAWSSSCAATVQADSPAAATDTSAVDSSLDRAFDLIEQKFIRELSREQIAERALDLLTKDLDPYSRYLTKQELVLYSQNLTSEYAGIGVRLDLDEKSGLPQVRFFLVDSAAARAGLARGDRIAQIDGRPIQGLSYEQVAELLRGPPGSTVELSILRDNSATPVDLVVTRMMVKTPSVRALRRDQQGRSEYLLDGDKGIAYIRVSQLAKDTVPQLESTLADLRLRKMRGLVLDLRECTGGLMTAALGAADLFLDGGLMLSVVERGNTAKYHAKPGDYTDFPIVVLINAHTASSGEILAGALKDNARASLLGQRTYGKGRIQVVYGLGDGLGGMILSVGTFHRPSGKTIDRHDAAGSSDAGIAPDPQMEVIVAGDEYQAWAEHTLLMDGSVSLTEQEQNARPSDRMLDRALQVLATLLPVQAPRKVSASSAVPP